MANGILGLLGDSLGTTPPEYLQGILGENAVQDLRKRSIGSGLVNALIGYAAAPKNQDLGLGRILASAAQSGIQGAQGVYKNATEDYMMQQKIAEMQRQKQQQTRQISAIEQAAAQFPEYADAIRANPELLKDIVAARMKPTESPFAKVNPKDFTSESINQFVRGGGKDYSILDPNVDKAQATEAIKNFEYAQKKGYKGSFEEWAKALTPYQLAQLGIDKAQLELQINEARYKFGMPPRAMPKIVTLTDIADTAEATGRTTAEVTADIKKLGIKIQGVQ
jgi:hypothetical protein